MDTPELVVWSAMLGGLATLAAFALTDALIRRSVASWHAFIFVVLTGAACVLLTGLVEALLPDVSQRLVYMFQNSLALLSGALTLSYLGQWMGIAADDRVVRTTVGWGAAGLVLASLTMAVLTLVSPPEDWHGLLRITTAINGFALLLPAIVSIRAAMLGDRLAWGMVACTALLTVVVAGLYARALHIDGLGPAVSIVTAVCTVAFFMLGTYLGLRRDRINRQLQRLAGLARRDDPATGLPKGSVLVSKVDDAIWRSTRMNLQCTVICMHVRNLYELAEIAGHGADQQILSAMSARMRRAIGFNHLMGLYHPQCFVVVISTSSKTRLVEKILQRLRYLMTKPLQVTGTDEAAHTFMPRVGIGSVLVTADNADPAFLIEQAERLSLATEQETSAYPSSIAPSRP